MMRQTLSRLISGRHALPKSVALVAGLGLLIGLSACTSGSHLAYVTIPGQNSVAAYRIKNSSDAFTSIVGSPYLAGQSPSAIVVHPSGRFAYVANRIDNTISLFKIDQTIGSLSEVLPRTPTDLDPAAMTMNPSGTLLFVVNEVSNTISVYSVNATSGALTLAAGSPFATAPSPIALALTPSAKYLYVLNGNLGLVFAYSVTSAGGLQSIAGSPFLVGIGPFGLTVDPKEKFVYVANSSENTVSILSINSTGALSQVSGSPFPT